MSFIRKVKTSSGATAVQIARKEYGRIAAIEHIGSAHSEEELELLLKLARDKLDQFKLTLFPEEPIQSSSKPKLKMKLIRSYSELLYSSLAAEYNKLGFNTLGDEVFLNLCIARLVEPVSKLDSIRVLRDLGINAGSEDNLYRCLARAHKGKYQDILAKACFTAASSVGMGISLVLYDVTTLYFEAQKEDEDIVTDDGTNPGFRKSGMSKERRLDPQIVVGLLVDQNGFPLELQSFPGDTPETKTILPVMESFKKRYGLAEVTVVADAGMLSAHNLSEIDAAGYGYVVGSRMTKIPYDIGEYQSKTDPKTKEIRAPRKPSEQRKLNDQQIIVSETKTPGQRVIYQYRAKRAALDLRNIEKQIEKAERVISGKSPQKKVKFLQIKTEGKFTSLNQELVAKAKALAGIKGYVTNLKSEDFSSEQVISSYHQLWQVEQSFRMSKHDLRARPIFHHQRESIEAHLTLVFASLAIGRTIERKTGISIKKFVKVLRPMRTGLVRLGEHRHKIEPEISEEVEIILEKLSD